MTHAAPIPAPASSAPRRLAAMPDGPAGVGPAAVRMARPGWARTVGAREADDARPEPVPGGDAGDAPVRGNADRPSFRSAGPESPTPHSSRRLCYHLNASMICAFRCLRRDGLRPPAQV